MTKLYLNKALKTLRLFHELKQKDISETLGVARGHVSEIESGKKYPSIQLLEKYSNYFNIPISNIFLIAEGEIEIKELTVNTLSILKERND